MAGYTFFTQIMAWVLCWYVIRNLTWGTLPLYKLLPLSLGLILITMVPLAIIGAIYF